MVKSKVMKKVAKKKVVKRIIVKKKIIKRIVFKKHSRSPSAKHKHTKVAKLVRMAKARKGKKK